MTRTNLGKKGTLILRGSFENDIYGNIEYDPALKIYVAYLFVSRNPRYMKWRRKMAGEWKDRRSRVYYIKPGIGADSK